MNQSGGLIMHNPINYYNENWAKYVKETINLDMSEQYNFFTGELNGIKILDFGCGSGRDSLYFKSLHYKVVASEPCENLRTFASSLIDQPVLKIDYTQIGIIGNEYINNLDGIWACASLLHAPKCDMDSLLRRLSGRLKKSGIIYCSFVNEDSEKMIGQRFYNSYTYQTFSELIYEIEDLYIRKALVSNDLRKGNKREWINFIVKKR